MQLRRCATDTGTGRVDGVTATAAGRESLPIVFDSFRPMDYWLLPEITTHLGFLLALVFLAYLIRQKRSPASTMAWLLLVLFLPYVGVPLYLMLGGRKMNRMARKKASVYEPASHRRGAAASGRWSDSSSPTASRPPGETTGSSCSRRGKRPSGTW